VSAATIDMRKILEAGPVLRADVMAAMAERGWSEEQTRKAKLALDVETERRGFGPDQTVRWLIPTVCKLCGHSLDSGWEQIAAKWSNASAEHVEERTDEPPDVAQTVEHPVDEGSRLAAASPSPFRARNGPSDCPRCRGHWMLPPGSLCPSRCGGITQ
jgi:predicted Zn-ribbon and HTH transcriptional regulator